MSFFVSLCPRLECPQVPSSTLWVTGSGPGRRLEPPVGKPGLGRAGAVPTTATPAPREAVRAGWCTLTFQGAAGPASGVAHGDGSRRYWPC